MFRNAVPRLAALLSASRCSRWPVPAAGAEGAGLLPRRHRCRRVQCDRRRARRPIAAPFPGGVDAGYDGTQGTVDLATADLSGYAVFVVPSLADGAGTQPYALLRERDDRGAVQAAFMGRVAVWSGTPDVGSTNRARRTG